MWIILWMRRSPVMIYSPIYDDFEVPMDTIKIRSCFAQDVTVISNEFLDRFLPEANGDFLRIYLYLLRTAGKRTGSFSLCGIADRMNCTENDVLRALRYWEREGVLTLSCGEDGEVSEIMFSGYCSPDAPGKEKEEVGKASDLTSERMAELGEKEDIRELLFIAQQYLGKPLSRSETQKICFFYDSLRFSPDLIDYLIDYCVSRGHTSFHYIEKVALGWKDQGITNVHEARIAAGSYHREYYDILKALGINNHHPVEAETRVMKKWIEKYGYPMEIITEACTRTVMNASRPTLNYTDGILSKWFSRGVRTLEDVARLDEEHSRSAPAVKEASAGRASRAKNSFTDFDQRTYDYSSLESQLLKKS